MGRTTRSASILRRLLRLATLALAVPGIAMLALHPSASYSGYLGTSTSLTTMHTACISPIQELVGHYASEIAGDLSHSNLAAGETSCQGAVNGREHIGWILVALAAVPFVFSFLALGRSRRMWPNSVPGQ